MLLPSFIPPCCGSGEEGGAHFKSRQEQNRCNAFVIRHLPDQKQTLTGQSCLDITPRGLKPSFFCCISARLKSAPDTWCCAICYFLQPVQACLTQCRHKQKYSNVRGTD